MSARCPICRQPAALAHRPFCSRRCRVTDLNRWFDEAYVIPGSLEEEEKIEDETVKTMLDSDE